MPQRNTNKRPRRIKIKRPSKDTEIKKPIDIPDEEISTPEIEEIREKLKQKLRPSEKMKLGRLKREAIKQEKIRLGIYVESESDTDDDLDMDMIDDDINEINKNENDNAYNINITNTGNGGDLSNAINTLVQNSLDMQKNPQNKQNNMNNIMTSVNQIIDNVMSNVMNKTGNHSITDGRNNKVNVYVKNKPNESTKVFDSFDFNNMGENFNVDFNENFKNFMNKDEDSDQDSDEDLENIETSDDEDEIEIKNQNKYKNKPNKNSMAKRGRPKKTAEKSIKTLPKLEDEENLNQKIHDKAKTLTNYKNNMMQYLDSVYDSEDEMDFDALAKKKEAEENGVNLNNLLSYDDEEELEENTIELDLSNPDFDNFKSLIDACEDYEKLINALNISIKDQAIRERNIQYISRRLKNLVSKIVVKEIKDCEKKDKNTKKKVKGGINELYSISAALCKLLDYPKGSKKAWTQVTKDVWGYINENGLKDPDNNAMIIPDKQLRKCLGIKKDTIRQLDLSSYIGAAIKGTKNKKEIHLSELDDGDELEDGIMDALGDIKLEDLDSDLEEPSESEDEVPVPKMKRKSPAKKKKTTKSDSKFKYKLKK